MTIEHPDPLHRDVSTLWEYHQMNQEPRPCSVGIGLGSHDLGVATFCAELFHRGMFPVIVFSGANSPTTRASFPRGEAVHYREEAMRLSVPPRAILVEARSTNTEQNLRFSRQLLADHGIEAGSVLLVSKPYQQRRAHATCRSVWPDVDVTCAAQRLPLSDYIAGIGDSTRVIDMLVGETQRILEYARRGHAIEQELPPAVLDAYANLVRAGYTSRLI
ncbi:MAG: hypothetical protein QOE72_3246 [Chloroflexota bacterium]|nr:hypothetical protein [Chloroflexota bacterium]